MAKVAVLMADGFEEVEALGVVDILRRAEVDVDTVSIKEEQVVISSRNIPVRADKTLTDMDYYDMIVIPGGAGAWTLRDDDRIISLIKKYDHEERYIAAICAGPMALGKAGVITNKKVTSYPGEEIESYLKAGKYVEEEVVVDGHIITSRGPATAFAFAYKLLDVLGIDSSSLKHGMLYDDLYK